MVNPSKGEVELNVDPDRQVLRGIDKHRPVILRFNANALCEAENEIRKDNPSRTIFDILDDAFVKNVPIGMNEVRILLSYGLNIPKESAGRIIDQKTTDYSDELLPKIGVALFYATEGNIVKVERPEESEEAEIPVVEEDEEDAKTGEKKRKK